MATNVNANFVLYPKHDLLAKFLIRVGLADLVGWNIINTNAAVVYVQLFNAAATGDVTLGSTEPKMILALPSGVGTSIFAMVGPENHISFPLGIVVAATTTPTGAIAPGAALVSEFFIN